MSSPFAPPPVETPDVVPPNVVPAPRAPMRTLILWVLLVVLLYAAYRVLSVPSPAAPPADAPAGHPIGWMAPAATYGALLIGLWWLRCRLPAQYRTGELREVEPSTLRTASAEPAVEPPALEVPAPPIDLTLDGRDPNRPVRLRIDDAGIHWHAPERLLLAAQELHIAWSDLESLVVVRRRSALAVWLVVVGGAVTLGALGAMRVVAGAVTLAALVVVVALGRRTATLVVGTATHALQFSSRALDPQTEERVVLAARARAPHAVPADGAPVGGTWRALLWEPFVLLAGQLRGDADIHAEMVRGGATPIDADTTRASTLQWRMFALWAGVLRAAGPLSLGVGLAVVTGGLGALVWGTLLGWVLGLVVMARANTAFARFTGMSLVRRPTSPTA